MKTLAGHFPLNNTKPLPRASSAGGVCDNGSISSDPQRRSIDDPASRADRNVSLVFPVPDAFGLSPTCPGSQDIGQGCGHICVCSNPPLFVFLRIKL